MADPYANLNPAFTSRLQAFINASGGLVSPGSGYRTEAEQAQLYNAYKAGVPGQARAAPPGKSQHNHGLAMDLKFKRGGREWAHQHAAEFGLYFPMEDEPWHIQPAGLDSTTLPGAAGLRAAGIDPKDELASRLQQVMSIMLGTDPSDLPAEIAPNPQADKYLNSIFQSTAPTMTAPVQLAGGDRGQLQSYAQKAMEKYGWGPTELKSLIKLWDKESGWNPQARNKSSSAAGIAQKMQSIHGAVEPSGEGQIDWGLQYIANRYGSPSAALKFHLKNNWY